MNMCNAPTEIVLRLPNKKEYQDVFTAALDNAAGLFGLHRRKKAALLQAAKLLFQLCRHATSPDEQVRAVIAGQAWGVALRFSLDAANGNLSAAILKALECNPAAGLQDACCIPLLQGVDRFRFERQDRESVVFILEQHRHYDDAPLPPTPDIRAPFAPLAVPDPAELREACGRALALGGNDSLPSFLANPDRFVDLVTGGRIQACLTLDAARQPATLLCWERYGPHHALFFGPYLCGRTSDAAAGAAATVAVEQFLDTVGANRMRGVIGGLSTPLLPQEYFDVLGVVHYGLGAGQRLPVTVPYRHLREDTGATVWAPPDLEDFLRREYRRLAFVREIRPLPERLHEAPEHSVFFLDIRQGLLEATLTPITAGVDAQRGIARLTHSLQRSGMRDIFFHLDLAESSHAALAPALYDAGYSPVFIVPGADRSDSVVFHHALF